MPNIQIYTKSYCPYCARAKDTLKRQGLSFNEIEVSNDKAKESEMRRRSHRTSVPQIFINDVHIGGSDDLNAAVRSGQLSEIIEQQSSSSN